MGTPPSMCTVTRGGAAALQLPQPTLPVVGRGPCSLSYLHCSSPGNREIFHVSTKSETLKEAQVSQRCCRRKGEQYPHLSQCTCWRGSLCPANPLVHCAAGPLRPRGDALKFNSFNARGMKRQGSLSGKLRCWPEALPDHQVLGSGVHPDLVPSF